MIDNLEDAINHARKVAKEQRDKSEQYKGCISDYFKYMFAVCLECAKEHEQLADWLEELKQRREADRWIPVTERLPEEGNKAYLTTVDYGTGGIASCQRFFYNDEIGWNDDCVIAWRPLPEPYMKGGAE